MNISQEAIADYLNTLSSVTLYETTESDKQWLAHHSLEEYLFQRVISSGFRRSKVDPELAENMRGKIHSHLAEGSPISFAVPFGAYKHWMAWSYPEPEWAEVFNVNYMLRYVAPIAAAYTPGVVLHYSYGDFVMDTVSNMPRCDTDKYISQVKGLIAFFQERARNNVSIDAVRINDFYTEREHKAEFRAHYEDNLKNWTRKYSDEERNNKLASALRNLMPKGVDDLTSLTDEQWHQRALTSAMWCDAHDSLSRRRGFNKYSGHVQLGNIKGRRLELHVGSCDTSVHQFWVGVGLIEIRGTRFLQRIVSQERLDSMMAETNSEGAPLIVRMGVTNEFSKLSNNYRWVYVLDNSTRQA